MHHYQYQKKNRSIQNNNKASRRTKKRPYKFIVNNNNNPDSDINKINNSLFGNDIKVLSRPKDSASNSLVLYNNIDGYGYIYKISPANGDIMNEADIYRRLNVLILDHVTPHLFLNFGSGKIRIPEDSKLYPLADKNWDANIPKKLFCQINETGPDTTKINPMYTIHSSKQPELNNKRKFEQYSFDLELLKNPNWARIYYNISFQIYWTLQCLNCIGLYQGDTHEGNIMLIFDDINLLDNPEDESFKPENIKYNSYSFTKRVFEEKGNDYIYDVKTLKLIHDYRTYYLEDIGIHVYIYDFDKGFFEKNRFTLNQVIHTGFITAMQSHIKRTMDNTSKKEEKEEYKKMFKLMRELIKNEFLIEGKTFTDSHWYKMNMNNGNEIYDKFIETRGNDGQLYNRRHIWTAIDCLLENFEDLVLPTIPEYYPELTLLISESELGKHHIPIDMVEDAYNYYKGWLHNDDKSKFESKLSKYKTAYNNRLDEVKKRVTNKYSMRALYE